jgi:hypothetical protein
VDEVPEASEKSALELLSEYFDETLSSFSRRPHAVTVGDSRSLFSMKNSVSCITKMFAARRRRAKAFFAPQLRIISRKLSDFRSSLFARKATQQTI